MSKVVLFKLISGEEIMGGVIMRGLFIELEDVVTLVYQQAGEGRMTVGFSPFMPYSDEKNILLNPSSVAAEATPKDQILQEYNRVFSKIVIASAGSLI